VCVGGPRMPQNVAPECHILPHTMPHLDPEGMWLDGKASPNCCGQKKMQASGLLRHYLHGARLRGAKRRAQRPGQHEPGAPASFAPETDLRRSGSGMDALNASAWLCIIFSIAVCCCSRTMRSCNAHCRRR
jgi:hypothetical protein